MRMFLLKCTMLFMPEIVDLPFHSCSHRKRYRSEDRQREPLAMALPLLREIWNAFVLQSQAIDAHQRRVLALPAP